MSLEQAYTLKNSRFLTVPLNKEARGKSARDFQNLFFLRANDGNRYLVRERGGKLKFMYWLTEKVVIPERSFIRGGFDKKQFDIRKFVEKNIDMLIHQDININQFYNRVGQKLTQIAQKYLTDLRNPANSPITLAGKSPKSNPLINSGRLRESITWKVE